ncbi:hypothetical protein CWC22_010105 [Pseudoalteromonas rubra]|uniref:EF-hand domain-containing protein n=1 Tax=Pseudoalteromonas rubra TaxID=43658 RepID=A0A7S7YTF7_9GAMM|nr:hypothetical protein [Pseudoalteromonas rubra]QPB83324.1 hypothetical protein CWC22_010105 [Pseudoalteromonas rubra]
MSIETAVLLRMIGYVLFLVLPMFVPFFKGLCRKPFKVLTRYTLCVVLMYLALAAPVYNLNYQLDLVVAQMDRDGNGSISPVEEATWTETEIKARKMRVADGGRNVFGYALAPYLALTYSAIVFLMTYLSIWLFGKIKTRVF